MQTLFVILMVLAFVVVPILFVWTLTLRKRVKRGKNISISEKDRILAETDKRLRLLLFCFLLGLIIVFSLPLLV